MNSDFFYIETTSKIKVEILREKNSIGEAKALDDLVFKEHQGISLIEITAIAKQGGLLGIRSSDGTLIAESQIIFHSIPGVCKLNSGTALCYGSAVHPSYRRLGLGQSLMKAKVKLASEKDIKRLILTVRPENAPAILLWEKCGFNIYGYDHSYFGDGPDSGRLLMGKELVSDRNSIKDVQFQSESYEIELRTGSKPDINAREALSKSMECGHLISGYRYLENEIVMININIDQTHKSEL